MVLLDGGISMFNYGLTFFIAQLFGVISIVLNIMIVQFKTKEKMLIGMIISNLVVAMQFFLLNAITGGVISLINVIRCIVFYLFKKKNRKPSLFILITFELIVVASGIISWQNIWSLLPIIATATYTYGIWQDDVLKIKYISAIIGFEWSIYDIIVRAYVGFIQGIIQVVSAIIAIILYKKPIKKRG